MNLENLTLSKPAKNNLNEFEGLIDELKNEIIEEWSEIYPTDFDVKNCENETIEALDSIRDDHAPLPSPLRAV